MPHVANISYRKNVSDDKILKYRTLKSKVIYSTGKRVFGVCDYLNDPKFSDRLLLEEESDQGLPCLPFHLHRLDSLLYGRAT